jgi:hypothetical protein
MKHQHDNARLGILAELLSQSDPKTAHQQNHLGHTATGTRMNPQKTTTMGFHMRRYAQSEPWRSRVERS